MKLNLRKPTLYLIWIIVLLLVAFIISKIQRNLKDAALSESTQTFGIYIRDVRGVGATGKVFSFRNDEGETIIFRSSKNLTGLQIGDTVLIQYSIKDNSIADVVSTTYP